MSYEIVQNFIPGLPKTPYDGGVGAFLGVVAHATDNVGDSADGERNYESSTWQDAFVHFFVDDSKIEQVADLNYICYGAGHTANHSGYVQVELCETSDATKFAKAFDKYLWLLAKLLHDKKLPVVDGVTLMSHAQVSSKWHESTHTDPLAYLAKFGKTWADVVSGVTTYYNGMEVKKVKNIVVYGNSIDKRAAEYVADFLECSTLDGSISYDYSNIENVVGVGAAPTTNGRTGWTSYVKKVIAGTDRYDTCQKALDYIKNGGK